VTAQPVEYVFATPKAMGLEPYRRFCERTGLNPNPTGYGMLLCFDEDGNKMTMATLDVPYFEMLIENQGPTVAGLVVDPGVFPIARPGWPDAWGPLSETEYEVAGPGNANASASSDKQWAVEIDSEKAADTVCSFCGGRVGPLASFDIPGGPPNTRLIAHRTCLEKRARGEI